VFLHHVFAPQIESIVHIPIGQYRRPHSPYKVASFFFQGPGHRCTDRSETP
jgi:hypothetical protein